MTLRELIELAQSTPDHVMARDVKRLAAAMERLAKRCVYPVCCLEDQDDLPDEVEEEWYAAAFEPFESNDPRTEYFPDEPEAIAAILNGLEAT